QLLHRSHHVPGAGGRGRRAVFLSLLLCASVQGDRRRTAGLGLVVRRETPTADDGGQPTEGEDREAIRRDTHKPGSSSALCSKSNRIADIRAVPVVPGADARRFLPPINPLGRLVNLTRTLASLLGPARVSDLTQQSGRRAMFS